MGPQDILDFWFNELEPRQWFIKDIELDELISERYLDIHTKASSCELYSWRQDIYGRLAEVIILDQFSRNIYRDKPSSFAQDQLALALSQEAISLELDKKLTPVEKSFLYMPFMHSESQEIHKIAVKLYSGSGLEQNLDFEYKHKVIIDRFGRYPHRNEILGRASTKEEVQFLKEDGSSF